MLSLTRAGVSYSDSPEIREAVVRAGIKLLPKVLVPEVGVVVDKKLAKWSRNVDMVWVEDEKIFVDILLRDCYSHLAVDVYHDPVSFMEDVHQYPLDTRIILDTYYFTPDKKPYAITGFAIARELHNMGYTRLILFAGEMPDERWTPPKYLKIVLKSDLVGKENLDKL